MGSSSHFRLRELQFSFFLADEGPTVAGEVGVLSTPMSEETPNSDSEKAGKLVEALLAIC